MKKLNQLALALFAVVLGLGAASCNDNKTDYQEMFMAFVTYTSSSDNGSVFTTRPNLDETPVTFTSTVVLAEKDYPLGQRYIIGYTNQSGERFQSGPINLMSIMKIINGKVEKATPEAIKDLTSTDVTMDLIQREGTYINFQATGPIQIQPKKFGLYVDENTITDKVPQVYVGFETDNTGGTMRTFFASIDIADIWNLPTCEGINIHFKVNGVDKELLFERKAHITPDPTE